MTEELQQPSSRNFSITLPRRALLWVAGAFVLGLLLFALIWFSSRDKTFLQADGQPSPAQEVALAPLPTPLSAGGASQMPAAQPGSGQPRPHLVEEPAPPAPTPLAEATGVQEPTTTLPMQTGTDSSSDRPPLRIAGQSPAPEYPASALRKGESGVVLVNVLVDAQGLPSRVSVAQRSGSRALDRAALNAVRRWRFQPALSAGQPVPGEVQIPIEFSP